MKLNLLLFGSWICQDVKISLFTSKQYRLQVNIRLQSVMPWTVFCNWLHFDVNFMQSEEGINEWQTIPLAFYWSSVRYIQEKATGVFFQFLYWVWQAIFIESERFYWGGGMFKIPLQSMRRKRCCLIVSSYLWLGIMSNCHTSLWSVGMGTS